MLINGKSLSQIKEEIMAPEQKSGDKEGKPYYEYWQFKKRLDAVLGLNYSTEYSQVQTVVCGTQTMMSCVCTILILEDDTLRPVIKRSGVGGREFISYREGNGVANFQSTPGFAERAAFCEACKDLGMFGYEEGGSKSRGGTKKTTTPNVTTSNFKNGVFITHSVMTKIEKGDGSITYFLNILDGEDEKELVFYPNQYKKVEDTFNAFREYLISADLVKGVKLEILYSEGSRGGIIFKGFPDKKRG